MRSTLPKAERLSGKKKIQQLFALGTPCSLFPVKIIFLASPVPEGLAHEVLFTVPKHLYKRAVDRNRIKRRMREGYRLQKHLLKTQRKYLIAYIYTAADIMSSAIIHDKIALSFKRIAKHED